MKVVSSFAGGTESGNRSERTNGNKQPESR